MLAQEEGLWFWDFEGNKMFYDVEEQVRFRVKNVKFQKPPSVQELRSRGGEDDLSGTAAKPIAVMQVVHVEQYLTSWHSPTLLCQVCQSLTCKICLGTQLAPLAAPLSAISVMSPRRQHTNVLSTFRGVCGQ